ncbi:MAG: hypothetical protein V1815_00710 [Candidatus Woesearchaeota archaeon]
MKEELNYIDNLVKTSLDDSSKIELSEEVWHSIDKKLTLRNFFKFSLYHFNFYYVAILVVSVTIGGIFAFLHSKKNELNDENIIELNDENIIELNEENIIELNDENIIELNEDYSGNTIHVKEAERINREDSMEQDNYIIDTISNVKSVCLDKPAIQKNKNNVSKKSIEKIITLPEITTVKKVVHVNDTVIIRRKIIVKDTLKTIINKKNKK